MRDARGGTAQLEYLQDLKEPPTEDTPTLKRVRQSHRYEVWRLSHPFREGIAIRLIVWVPPDAPPVIVLFGNDKAQMGDVFHSSAPPNLVANVLATCPPTELAPAPSSPVAPPTPPTTPDHQHC